jgi:exodeoxyribonuclease VII small subunit
MTGADDLQDLTFEQLMDELERITRQMAAGDIGIEEVADLFERAGALHGEASARLERVRERIARLAAPDGAGEVSSGRSPAGGADA